MWQAPPPFVAPPPPTRLAPAAERGVHLGAPPAPADIVFFSIAERPPVVHPHGRPTVRKVYLVKGAQHEWAPIDGVAAHEKKELMSEEADNARLEAELARLQARKAADPELREAVERLPKFQVRKYRYLPAHAESILKAWFVSDEHIRYPYPTQQDQAHLMVRALWFGRRAKRAHPS